MEKLISYLNHRNATLDPIWGAVNPDLEICDEWVRFEVVLTTGLVVLVTLFKHDIERLV
jgi:hypothetical protein